MENYPSNSHKTRELIAAQEAKPEEKKKIEKVVTTPVKTKKKSGWGKFFGNLVSDNAQDIKTYVVSDVIIPSIKKAISDTVDTILFGGSRKGSSSASKISYRSFYDEPRMRSTREPATPVYSYDDIIIPSRGEAEEVLNRLNELLDMYQIASVADLYDLVGVTGNYTDNKYGWTNLQSAEVVRVRDGYMIKLPRPMPIK